MFKKLIPFLLTLPLMAAPIGDVKNTFKDDLVLPGKTENQEVMLCLHGFGMDQSIAEFVSETEMAPHHLVSFNFPDFGPDIDVSCPEKLSFGSIEELKPVIERLHRCITDLEADTLHLYGFSAGGGAAANTLAVLKEHRFQEELGLTAGEMDAIYAALERGTIVLDCPLKSIDEIADEIQKNNAELEMMAKIYRENDLRPIDSIAKLEGSSLQVLLVLQDPDDTLSNRDDELYIARLEEANRLGKTVIVIGPEGLHAPALPTIVEFYQKNF